MSEGKILAEASQEYPCYYPQPLWSEQDPEDWWQATVATIQAVVKKAKLKAADVKAIGLSGQMHGSVFLDKSGKVIRRALLWNDQRTQAECEEIEQPRRRAKKADSARRQSGADRLHRAQKSSGCETMSRRTLTSWPRCCCRRTTSAAG